jgi:hypothetical protein
MHLKVNNNEPACRLESFIQRFNLYLVVDISKARSQFADLGVKFTSVAIVNLQCVINSLVIV